MDTLAWKTARIFGHPDGDIWVVIAADHFDTSVGALDTVAAAGTLMRQALPDGGLAAEYLFLEQLERVALAAEIAAMQAQRDFLRCSVLSLALPAARARVESVRHRYVSDTMATLEAVRKAQGNSAFDPGDAFVAMQAALSQPVDARTTVTIPWEMIP